MKKQHFFIVITFITLANFSCRNKTSTSHDKGATTTDDNRIGLSENEEGNALASGKVLDFPHFGRFDLSEWKKQKIRYEEGGDASHEIQPYAKGDQILEVNDVRVSEYGAGRSYTLQTKNGKVLKERDMHYSADLKNLTETSIDYTSNKRYERSQKYSMKYPYDINAFPDTVNGEWNITMVSSDLPMESGEGSEVEDADRLPEEFASKDGAITKNGSSYFGQSWIEKLGAKKQSNYPEKGYQLVRIYEQRSHSNPTYIFYFENKDLEEALGLGKHDVFYEFYTSSGKKICGNDGDHSIEGCDYTLPGSLGNDDLESSVAWKMVKS